MWSAAVTHSTLLKTQPALPLRPVPATASNQSFTLGHVGGCSKRRFPEASHGRVPSHIDRHRSLKSSFPELSEKYWVDRYAVTPKRAIVSDLELRTLLQSHP